MKTAQSKITRFTDRNEAFANLRVKIINKLAAENCQNDSDQELERCLGGCIHRICIIEAKRLRSAGYDLMTVVRAIAK